MANLRVHCFLNEALKTVATTTLLSVPSPYSSQKFNGATTIITSFASILCISQKNANSNVICSTLMQHNTSYTIFSIPVKEITTES